MIKIKNLTKIYRIGTFGFGKLKAVDNVSFDIPDSTIVSLIGESGSGKTTIGKMILRLIKPTSGKIYFRDKDIFELKKDQLKWFYKRVQGVFQDPFASFNPFYKVDRVFNLIFREFFPEVNENEKIRRVNKVLKEVGLNPKDVIGKYPHQLSGGQLQRVLIARALLLEVDFLVADEIISMLDASTRIDILNLLANLKEKGLSILFITHDLSLGYYISDYTFIMYKGNIVEWGRTDLVYKNSTHPYTKMLMESVPTDEKKWEAKFYIFEESKKIKSNCKYAFRCPFYDPKKCENIKIIEVEKDHKVLCGGV